MSSLLHSIPSSRRPPSPKDDDYDHEIRLIDHTQITARLRSHSTTESNHRDPLQPPEDVSPRRHSDDQLRKKLTLREEVERRRYSKPRYQNRHLRDDLSISQAPQDVKSRPDDVATMEIETPSDGVRPMTGESTNSRKKARVERESAIDVLYENQRGSYLCGKALFSSKALGAADFPPWTNAAQKPSATNITNAQVPDPSWEWAWNEWSVNHSDDVDEDGWEYSFAFSKKNFWSWHGPKWYNSFVRRRAWIRKRVKKDSGYLAQEAHRLSSDYFTIQPAMSRSRSPSKAPSMSDGRYSIGQLSRQEIEDDVDREDIRDIGQLMKALKLSRIDREKMEAVENFIKNGGDDLYYLREHMHEIMSQFIFQASRRSLLAHLSTLFDEETQRCKENAENDKEDVTEKRRTYNLEAALKAADEEVKTLEFWSDIKDMAEQGDIKGAVDESQGWDQKKWTGLDNSGPKDVISDRDLAGTPPNANELDKHENDIGKGKERALHGVK
jgi:hypothetical protein